MIIVRVGKIHENRLNRDFAPQLFEALSPKEQVVIPTYPHLRNAASVLTSTPSVVLTRRVYRGAPPNPISFPLVSRYLILRTPFE